MSARLVALAAALVLGLASTASAQTLRVTADRTILRDKPATDGAVVSNLAKGDELTVVERAGTWYRVRTGGGQEGYVSSLLVEVVPGAAPAPAAASEASPAPPSPPSPAAPPSPAPSPAPTPSPATPPTTADVAPADTAGDQGGGMSAGGDFHRVWLDVNAGVAMAAEKTAGDGVTATIFGETATFRADYEFPRGGSFDLGAGYMFTETLGVGVSLAGTAHAAPGIVGATIPHPRFFNAAATDTAETANDIERTESMLHLQGIVAIPLTDRVRLRVFGGPSRFTVKQDTVTNIRYDQVAGLLTPANAVTITGTDISESEASAWGFHAGGDLSFFLSEHFGVGAFARFSRATVERVDLAGRTVESKAGGFQAGGGLRVKF